MIDILREPDSQRAASTTDDRDLAEGIAPPGPAADVEPTPTTHPDPATDMEPAASAPPEPAMQAIQAIEAMQAVDDPPLLADAVAIHTRWQENQATFVDDPLGSVTRAASLADEVVSVVTAAAQERVHDLRTAWEGGSA